MAVARPTGVELGASPRGEDFNSALELRFGVAKVTVPEGGFRPTATPRRVQLRHWSDQDYEVADLQEVGEVGARKLASASSVATGARPIPSLILIHGYWTTLEKSLQAGARLAVGLELQTPIMVLNWHSAGSILGYLADGENFAASSLFQAKFQEWAAKGGRVAESIVAHSMGNRVLLQAVKPLVRPVSQLYGHIVMVAPDVAVSDFVTFLPELTALSEKVTLYASHHDRALVLSGIGNWPKDRLGKLPPVRAFAGVHTIACDAGPIAVGVHHSYLYHDPAVIADIRRATQTSDGPTERGLESRIAPDGSAYWSIGLTTLS